MGYHIILRNSKNGLDRKYVETLEELVEIDGLTTDTIIYQGEKQWEPARMDTAQYVEFLNEKFRAGIRAQNCFIR